MRCAAARAPRARSPPRSAVRARSRELRRPREVVRACGADRRRPRAAASPRRARGRAAGGRPAGRSQHAARQRDARAARPGSPTPCRRRRGTSRAGRPTSRRARTPTSGQVGVAITSQPRNAASKSRRKQRAHLLRLAVVGVVVAGREHVGAEQDAALHLGAEALRARAQVHLGEARARRARGGRSARRRSARGCSTPRRWRSGSRRRPRSGVCGSETSRTFAPARLELGHRAAHRARARAGSTPVARRSTRAAARSRAPRRRP